MSSDRRCAQVLINTAPLRARKLQGPRTIRGRWYKPLHVIGGINMCRPAIFVYLACNKDLQPGEPDDVNDDRPLDAPRELPPLDSAALYPGALPTCSRVSLLPNVNSGKRRSLSSTGQPGPTNKNLARIVKDGGHPDWKVQVALDHKCPGCESLRQRAPVQDRYLLRVPCPCIRPGKQSQPMPRSGSFLAPNGR